ncbi:helix-turn-helix transcriptional regulator [Nonomuraea sp. NPDC050310]|uniref:helix-turn-helix transcriptional regulator n=1 Tax=Nonomuraea sp. NPDC050310 TaxID=3154935 RepID=UPI0033FCBF58
MPSQGTIGDRVRGLRLNRRMSQAQLAGPDLSDSYVSLIESGKRTPTPVVARLLAERLGCTTEFLLHGIEPRQRIDTELGLRHAELELRHGDAALAAERFNEIVKAVGEENAMLAAQARLGRARSLEEQGRLGQAVEAMERLRAEASAHPERLADLPLTIALSRCYQRAGDRLRARDLGLHALGQMSRLGVDQGELAVDLAATLIEIGEDNPTEIAFLRRVLETNGVPEVLDRSAEIRTLWEASKAAAAGEDSALAVRLADDAIAAGRPARLGLQLARAAMHWARLESCPVAEAEEHVTAAARALSVFTATRGELGESQVIHARVRLRAGDPARAGELATTALELLGEAPGTVTAQAHLVLAQVSLGLGADATGSLTTARALLTALEGPLYGANRQAARTWRELGDLFGQVGARADQTSAYRKALEAAGVRSALAGVTVHATTPR